MKKLFFIIYLFFLSFIFSKVSFAATIDNFDSYTTGSVIGQGGWQAGTDPAYPLVSTSNSFSSPNGLTSYSLSNQSSAFKTLSISNPTYFGYMFKANSKNLTSSDLILFSNSSKTLINIYAQFNTTGTSLVFRTIDSSFNVQYSITTNYGVWHSVMYKFSSDHLTYQVSFDGSNYSSSYPSHNNGVNFTNINNIQLRYGYSSTSSLNTLTIDNLQTDENFLPNNDNVIIVNPPPSEYETVYTANEYWKYSRDIYCNYATTTPCLLNFSYTYSSSTREALLVNYPDNGETLDLVSVTQNATMSDTLTVPTSTTPIKNYCIAVVENHFELQRYCGITVHWSDKDVNVLLGIDEYDITQACKDVATSSGSYFDDFRYGIECGFNKSMYWLFTPKSPAIVKLVNAKNDLMNEFPLNVFQNMWVSMQAPYNNSASTTQQFDLPLYVGNLNNNGSTTITVFSTPNLHSLWGETWDNIYEYMRIIIYFFTFVYFFKWFILRKDEQAE